MKGKRANRRRYKLVFPEDSDLYGLEITIVGSTLGEQRKFVQNFPKDADSFGKLEYEIREFLRNVVEWNLLDDEDNPLPKTYEAYEGALDVSWITAINQAWGAAALGKPSVDTGKELSGSETSDRTHSIEASIPMETVSMSPSNT